MFKKIEVVVVFFQLIVIEFYALVFSTESENDVYFSYHVRYLQMVKLQIQI